MDLKKIDLSLFKKQDVTPVANVPTSSGSPSSRLLVKKVANPGKLAPLKNDLQERISKARAFDTQSGLIQLRDSLKSLSKELQKLQKELGQDPIAFEQVDAGSMSRSSLDLKTVREILSETSGLSSAERKEIKGSLSRINSELKTIQENIRAQNREFFGTENLKDKEPSLNGMEIVEDARRTTIALKQDIEKKLDGFPVEDRDDSSLAVEDPDDLSGLSQSSIDTLSSRSLKNQAGTVISSFKKDNDSSLLSQANPDREKIIQILSTSAIDKSDEDSVVENLSDVNKGSNLVSANADKN